MTESTVKRSNVFKDLEGVKRYVAMQRAQYESEASKWSLSNLDAVVGSFLAHNEFLDYELLFEDVKDLNSKVVLDFGTGPCRNIVKYHNRVKRIDGVDLIQRNIDNGKIWIEHNGLDPNNFKLFTTNGYDLLNVKDEVYDLIISTICMQHICCWSIRYNFFKEFYSILKQGGMISLQMGYGNSLSSVGYYEDFYDAKETNRGCDTRVESPHELEKDLLEIGFKDFKYYIRPSGAGDSSTPNWIYFNAKKP